MSARGGQTPIRETAGFVATPPGYPSGVAAGHFVPPLEYRRTKPGGGYADWAPSPPRRPDHHPVGNHRSPGQGRQIPTRVILEASLWAMVILLLPIAFYRMAAVAPAQLEPAKWHRAIIQ